MKHLFLSLVVTFLLAYSSFATDDICEVDELANHGLSWTFNTVNQITKHMNATNGINAIAQQATYTKALEIVESFFDDIVDDEEIFKTKGANGGIRALNKYILSITDLQEDLEDDGYPIRLFGQTEELKGNMLAVRGKLRQLRMMPAKYSLKTHQKVYDLFYNLRKLQTESTLLSNAVAPYICGMKDIDDAE